ncbi:MAG: extracellular solute-binding protein [Chitinispirillaceae bacterium]
MKKEYLIFAISTFALLAGCAAPVHLSVLAPMSQDQQRFLEKEILPRFENRNRCRIKIINVEDTDGIKNSIDIDTGSVGLVKVPFTVARQFAGTTQLLVMDSVLDVSGNKRFNQELLLTSLGAVDGKQYYVPREFETRLIVYRKSKVNEALRSWRRSKDAIDKSIKRVNGYGLPANYILEENPEEWDFYDIYVLGWIWASREQGGRMQPRIAHPLRENKGLTLRQIDHLVQLGADTSSIIGMQGDEVVDMFYWEAVYASLGIYNPDMWRQNWTSSDLWRAFGNDDVYLSFLTASDCFHIHGTGKDSLFGYLEDPEDMGVATMPSACSVELDDMGMPLRVGSKAVMTGGWWWGIPARSPDPVLSAKLACFLSQNENQIKECSSFGMIPVRKDVLSYMPIMFGDGWITQVYNTSFHQLMKNDQHVIAGDLKSRRIFSLYGEAWSEIIVGENWSDDNLLPDRAYIAKLIEDSYSPKAHNLLTENGAVYD